VESFDWSSFLATGEESPEEVHAVWHSAGFVDGLPVLPPTSARVRSLYRVAGLDPVRHLGVLEPSQRPVTVYDAAVCAAVTGCGPEHLPVLVAALHAVTEPAFNLLGIQTTTGSAAPAIIVHGPLVASAGVSGGSDCLGGSAVANARIGRALRIVLRSVGGAAPGGMDAATTGQPAKLGLCFAENVERSPWPELHIDRGFAAGEGAVTVVGISGSAEIVHAENEDADAILSTVAASMLAPGNLGGAGLFGGGSPLLVLSPEHAGSLARAGLSRADVQREVWERARIPVSALPAGARSRVRRVAADRQAAGDEPLTVARAPSDILIAVAGGVGVKSTFLPFWGGGTRAVTVRAD
jgi:hypothetical protein